MPTSDHDVIAPADGLENRARKATRLTNGTRRDEQGPGQRSSSLRGRASDHSSRYVPLVGFVVLAFNVVILMSVVPGGICVMPPVPPRVRSITRILPRGTPARW